jgi:NAD(P)H-dependent flavin oxidoreductase YrpB (nitropropane dioxygenase family)
MPILAWAKMVLMTAWPTIIQCGMGVGISHWRLARAVASQGQLGVVSGTALDQIYARRLQEGDPEGQSRQLGSATSRAGARCRHADPRIPSGVGQSKPARQRPSGATQREVASHLLGASTHLLNNAYGERSGMVFCRPCLSVPQRQQRPGRSLRIF